MSTYGSYVAEARTVFYNHKRQCHGGAYDTGCEECRGLWDNLLALLKGTGAADVRV